MPLDLAERFIRHARIELEAGNRLRAGEIAWAAVSQYLAFIGENRGWDHSSHAALASIGSHICSEHSDYPTGNLAVALRNAYERGHRKRYESLFNADEVEDLIEGVEETLPLLDTLSTLLPRPFKITRNSQLRVLRAVTGDETLDLGDESAVGFSLRHTP